eukprot:112599_1
MTQTLYYLQKESLLDDTRSSEFVVLDVNSPPKIDIWKLNHAHQFKEQSRCQKACNQCQKACNQCQKACNQFAKACNQINQCDHEKAWEILSVFLSFLLPATIVSEILLLINIYSQSDTIFFALSCLFLSIPLCTASFAIWFVALMQHGRMKMYRTLPYDWRLKLFYIPIINIPLYISYSKLAVLEIATGIETFLAGTMSFPLYIINISFLLETVSSYKAIPTFNLIQLTFSLISLTIAPMKYYVSKTYESYYKTYSLYEKIPVYLAVAFTFMPIVLIEVIHFFPFCFCYYVDDTLHQHDLIYVIILFNVPKIIFFSHLLFQYICNPNPNNDDDLDDDLDDVYGAIRNTLVCCLLTFVFITIPLVPYIMMMYSKKTIKDTNNLFTIKDCRCCSSITIYYWNTIIYLFISYGGSCIYVINVIGWNNISKPVQVSIICIFILIIFITLTFPLSFRCMKLSNVVTRTDTVDDADDTEWACFDDNGLVLMANGKRKKIALLKVGDKVRSFPNYVSEIECCVASEVNKKTLMVKLENHWNDNCCWITYEHPILVNHINDYNIDLIECKNIGPILNTNIVNKYGLKWILPTDIHGESYRFVNNVYNFVLKEHHTINVNGYWCCTLGHDFEGHIIGHPFWGNNVAIKSFLMSYSNSYPNVLFDENIAKKLRHKIN